MATAQTITKREKVVQYLEEQAENGNVFLKSRGISEDLNLSSKEIGKALGRLAESGRGRIQVEKWAETSATTWRIVTSD